MIKRHVRLAGRKAAGKTCLFVAPASLRGSESLRLLHKIEQTKNVGLFMLKLKRKLKTWGLETVLLIAFSMLVLCLQNESEKEKQYKNSVLSQAADGSWTEKTVKTFHTGKAQEDGKAEPELHALSAVLIDADSGRVLYGKNENEIRPMASTTKIMTCIVALEHAELTDVVTVSSYAASRPKVKLYMKRGERYRLEDLLYSIMLESHNDSAAAIAEYIGSRELGEKVTEQTSEADSRRYLKVFAGLMNQKAEETGCVNTWFITPNGLDAREEIEEKKKDGPVEKIEKVHSTTARELAQILRYCIKDSGKREAFLKITGTKSYAFSTLADNPRSFSCTNHNAFLGMMEGALTGKTGFTNQAGYCYVGALRRDNRTYIVALLGCGWPGNKTYKWADTRALMEYGLKHYKSRTVELSFETPKILVQNGVPGCGNFCCPCVTDTYIACEDKKFTCLMSDEDTLEAKVTLSPQDTRESLLYWNAPLKKQEQVGTLELCLNGETMASYPVCASSDVLEVKPFLCWQKILKVFLNLSK